MVPLTESSFKKKKQFLLSPLGYFDVAFLRLTFGHYPPMHQWPGAIILFVGKVYRYASICYYNIELSVILVGILFFPFF